MKRIEIDTVSGTVAIDGADPIPVTGVDFGYMRDPFRIKLTLGNEDNTEVPPEKAADIAESKSSTGQYL